jgi:hypothetical protein
MIDDIDIGYIKLIGVYIYGINLYLIWCCQYHVGIPSSMARTTCLAQEGFDAVQRGRGMRRRGPTSAVAPPPGDQISTSLGRNVLLTWGELTMNMFNH